MYLTSLDIGSSQIKVAVAELGNDKKLSLVEVFKFPSHGVRKGEVVDAQELTAALMPYFNELKKINKETIKNIFVNIGGKNIKMQNSRGIVAVSRADNEIYQDDVDRVVKASQAINLPPNRKIIHTIIREYIIDGEEQIQSPLGMNGTRLEVNSFIVDAFLPVISDLSKAIMNAGGGVADFIYNPLASASSVLSKTHKELGAVLIDIGFGTTSMCVFEEGKLITAKVFPIGSSNITNDLAIAFKSSVEVAEKIKLSYGHAYSRDVSVKDKINLAEFDKNLRNIVSKKFVSEIVESRVAEIFELVHNELKSLGKIQLPAGVVLCGGGAQIEGITDLAKLELKLPAHLANCELNIFDATSQDLVSKLENPDFAAVTGLLSYGYGQLGAEERVSNWLSDKKGLIARVLKNLIP